jgi:hypothetical protein
MYHLSAANDSRNPSDELSDPRLCFPTGETAPPTARSPAPVEDAPPCRRAEDAKCLGADLVLDEEACWLGFVCDATTREVEEKLAPWDVDVDVDVVVAAAAAAVVVVVVVVVLEVW